MIADDCRTCSALGNELAVARQRLDDVVRLLQAASALVPHAVRPAEEALELDGGLPALLDATHLERQRQWSGRTFGPGPRTRGVLAHIRKELLEIEADPLDVKEWVDVVILALDGAWRTGTEPQAILDAILEKQERNEGRQWPDWRTLSPDVPIEHVRGGLTS